MRRSCPKLIVAGFRMPPHEQDGASPVCSKKIEMRAWKGPIPTGLALDPSIGPVDLHELGWVGAGAEM